MEGTTVSEIDLPILKLSSSDIPERVLVVGDPARATTAADRLDQATELGRNREFVTIRGTLGGVDIAIVSHGVGASGATTCFEELCRGGARTIIRAGTAGGLQEDVRDGSVVVATAAVRDEGITKKIVPLGYPAVSDLGVALELQTQAESTGADVHTGIVLTSDLFYPHEVLGSDLRLWQTAGALAVEMETSALFVTGTQHGVATGSVLAIDGNPLAAEDSDMSGYDPHRQEVIATVDTTLSIALRTLSLR